MDAVIDFDTQLLAELWKDQRLFHDKGHLNGTKEASCKRLMLAWSRKIDLTGLEDLQALHQQVDAPESVVEDAPPEPEPKPATDEPEPDTSIDDDLLPVLKGLGPEARFRPVVGKNPGAKGRIWSGGKWIEDDGEKWNSAEFKWLTAAEITKTMRRKNHGYTGIGLMTGAKVGGYCWIDFDGEEVDQATGEIKSSATRDFMEVWKHPVAELPRAPRSISGREGRFRLLFKVPEAWCSLISGVSLRSTGPTKSIEFLFEMGKAREATPFHAIIDGKHPEGNEANGWHYRWVDGESPADVEVPDLPNWMLKGVLTWPDRQKAQQAASQQGGGGGDFDDEAPKPMDLLTPGKQKRLLKGMQEHFPYRGGDAGTKFAGHYPEIKRLTLSLYRGIDDEKLFEMWLQDWDDKSDWDGSKTGSAPIPGGMVGLAKSLANSNAGGESVRPWAAAWKIALDNGWKCPKWALPPREVDLNTLDIESSKVVVQLTKGLAQIDTMKNSAQRLAAQQSLTRSLGKSGTEMAQLLQAIEEGENNSQRCSMREVFATEITIEPVIEGLLSRGGLTVVASEGGLAKTSLCYQMAGAILTGSKFAGRLQAIEGPVVIVQKDENKFNSKQKLEQMDLRKWIPEEAQDRCGFYFDCWHPGMFPELKQWIEQEKAVAVFLDSLGTLFTGGGKNINDSETAMYLYRLNRLAAEMDVAIVLTHHLKKNQNEGTGKKAAAEENTGTRKKVKLSQLYGSSYIVNSATDVWGLCIDGGSLEDPVFALEVLKSRSNITSKGDLFHFAGSQEDLSFGFESFNLSTKAEPFAATSKDKILQALHRSETGALTQEELAASTGLSVATVKRVLGDLYRQRATTHVDRIKKQDPSITTKRPYGYFRCD